MAEPLAAAVHAVDRGTGATDVGVLGGGPMGLMLTSLLIAAGRNVTVADPHPERRAQAAELGAHAVETLASHDLMFEAVGRPEAWRDAAGGRAGGVVVLVGGCPAEPSHAADRPAPLRGARAPRFVPPLAGRDRPSARRARWQRRPVAELLGPTIPLEQLPAALATPTRRPRRKGGGSAYLDHSSIPTLRGCDPQAGPLARRPRVLDGPARVADRLTVDDQDRHPPLSGDATTSGRRERRCGTLTCTNSIPSRASVRRPAGRAQPVRRVEQR